MIAIEIKTAIVDHRLNIRSDMLPPSARRARVIALDEPTTLDLPVDDVLIHARAAQASFPKRATDPLAADMLALRDEWDRAL